MPDPNFSLTTTGLAQEETKTNKADPRNSFDVDGTLFDLQVFFFTVNTIVNELIELVIRPVDPAVLQARFLLEMESQPASKTILVFDQTKPYDGGEQVDGTPKSVTLFKSQQANLTVDLCAVAFSQFDSSDTRYHPLLPTCIHIPSENAGYGVAMAFT